MNIQKVTSEFKSPALAEVTEHATDTVNKIRSHEITTHQGSVELKGCRHIIHAIALDRASTIVDRI